MPRFSAEKLKTTLPAAAPVPRRIYSTGPVSSSAGTNHMQTEMSATDGLKRRVSTAHASLHLLHLHILQFLIRRA